MRVHDLRHTFASLLLKPTPSSAAHHSNPGKHRHVKNLTSSRSGVAPAQTRPPLSSR